MKIEKLTEMINSYQKDSTITLKWKKDIILKDKTTVIHKETEMSDVKLGANYGEIKESVGLVNKTDRVAKPVNWLIKDFVKVSESGKNLLLVYPTETSKSKTVWTNDKNEVIDVNTILDQMYAKDKPSHATNPLVVITVNVDNIID